MRPDELAEEARDLMGDLSAQSRVALEIARIFDVAAFRVRASSHEIQIQKTRDGRGYVWRCYRCRTDGAFVGPLEVDRHGRGAFHYLALARFTRDHTGVACPT